MSTLLLADIPVAALKAHLVAAAKDDILNCLIGVHVDPVAGCLVSTNGLIMALSRYAAGGATGNTACTLPRASVELAIKAAGKATHVTIELTGAPQKQVDGTVGTAYALRIGAIMVPADEATDAVMVKFPDWRRVIPQTLDGRAGTYDARLLHSADKVLRTLCGRETAKYVGGVYSRPALTQNGTSAPAVMTYDAAPDAFVIVMPLRYAIDVTAALATVTSTVNGAAPADSVAT